MNNENNETYLHSIQQQVTALQALVQSQAAQINELRQNEQRQKSGDLECNTVRCKVWKVVDSAGVDRMTAEISDNGDARILWCKSNGAVQIAIETLSDGSAAVLLRDCDGVARISAEIDSAGHAILPSVDLNPRSPIPNNESKIEKKYTKDSSRRQDAQEDTAEAIRMSARQIQGEVNLTQEAEADAFSTNVARSEDAQG